MTTAEERKRKRLEAWRRKQELAKAPAPKVSVSLSLGGLKTNKKKKKSPSEPKKKKKKSNAFFGDDDDGSDKEEETTQTRRNKPKLLTLETIQDASSAEPPKKRSRGRWDKAPTPQKSQGDDALDKFMSNLGNVASQEEEGVLNLDGMSRKTTKQPKAPVSGGVITPEELQRLTQTSNSKRKDDMEIDNNNNNDSANKNNNQETDDEEEEKARRAFIEALKSTPAFVGEEQDDNSNNEASKKPELAAEVKSEKQRREQRMKELEQEAENARFGAQAAAAPELGRLYNDVEGGVMEEAERNLDAAMAAPDALTVLAELNKKKELKAVDHSEIEYIDFQKNLFVVPRALASLTNDEVISIRAKLKVRVRGHGAPPPVSTFEQCGVSEKILQILYKQNIRKPFPVQAQCIPCIMSGRDVIGIAKTGSGKTLAYLLPMLRHIMVQPPLAPHESGPIGLILAPARELAYQIHLVCKAYCKNLGLKSTAVYGGASVAEQIADLKRGAHIVVATPGRIIDVLTMQGGKLLSLERVTSVCLDESDRMFDMGFAPQIQAIMGAVRPDRQTVLFSATFPKAVEALARKALKYPVEVMVGGRSVASDNVTQYAELVEEEDKFLRLLQILGEHVEGTKKAIVFLDTQVRTDSLFEQLLRSGYTTQPLHGGMEQEDRDSAISDFKRKDGPNVLVATGVAGRGLDVPSCTCVVNYSAPNHLEAYVHQVGRTGRAGNRGVAFTFVNSTNEEKFAPSVVRALSEAGQAENIKPELKKMSEEFKAKVEKGEAKFAGSGFKGKGYSYDKSELSEHQKMQQMEKRQALIEAGLLDPDDEEHMLEEAKSNNNNKNNAADGDDPSPAKKSSISAADKAAGEADKVLAQFGTGENQPKLTPELLALPGMKDAILRKAGIIKEPDDTNSSGKPDSSGGRAVQMGTNHFVQEFEINDYPREARWKVTQRETTSRLQDEFQTAVTLKGQYFDSSKTPGAGERKLYLHLEATSERILANCVLEIQRLLNEETLRVGTRGMSGGGSSHKYNVL
ncbi:processing ATP-dependent RNA helicase PRP5 [Seminavis robusta]|uniref:RNA helicase n=1 Tax=Seminavis robusta TaxID=568900 RepID=A0A9N8H731_9STRA|nr:processing ATP-dependent RNA helicase PRP5 [Seminavis robusta]|eukprot:Sro59_g034010.1 processing ATP-dependent RNA helicase PRP5 (1026) ;mRNA; f:10538-14070